jgi:hypothetical protein
MEKEDIISVQRAQEDVEKSYNLLNNNKWLLTKDILSGKSLYSLLEIQKSSAEGNIHFTAHFTLHAARD